MKTSRKNVVAAAGLSAVLALTPVAAPVGLAIADEGNGTAQSQAEQAITVTLVYMENGQWTNWAIPAQPYTALNADILAQIPQDGIECWTYTDANGNHEIAAENLSWATFTDSCTLTAQYAEQEETGYALTYKVTNPADGSYYETEATTEADGTIANGPEDPYAEGYVFTGWAVNGDTNNIVTSGAITSMTWTADTYFVAQFAPAAEEEAAMVTFQVVNPADGSEYEIDSPLTEDGYVAQPSDPTAEGYVFTGWAVNGDTDKIMTSGAVSATAWEAGTTFVAQFAPAAEEEAASVTFQVTEPSTGAQYEIVSPLTEDGYVAQPADPTVEGYDFVGWAVNGNINQIVTSGAAASLQWADGTTFVAQFVEQATEEEGVTVTYQVTSPADGSYYEIEAAADEQGNVAQPADPQIDGYTFVGWAVNGNTDNMYTSGAIASTAWTENTTFVAQFVQNAPAEAASVTFQVTEPGTGAYYEIESNLDDNGMVSEPADPTVDGYVFTGWAVNGDTDNIYTSGAVAMTPWADGTTFVAQFVPEAGVEAASVTFQVTEPGTGAYYEIESPLTEEGMVSQPADPDVDGYVFTGWAVNGDVDNIYTSGAIAATPWTDGTTFVAQFVEEAAPVADTFKVTFDDCIASTENQVVEVESGKTVAKPADPTCEGWTFLGWFTDTALTQEYDFNAPVTSDMTLYAKWQQNEVVTPGTDDPATTPAEPAAPAEENGEQAADEAAAADEQKLPQTGDNTMAVAGGVAAVAGVSALAALGAALKRRFQ